MKQSRIRYFSKESGTQVQTFLFLYDYPNIAISIIRIHNGKVEIHSVDLQRNQFQLALAVFEHASLGLVMLLWGTFYPRPPRPR